MGAQWNQRGKPQYAGSYLCPDCCVGRRSARFSLLPFCQTASVFRLICLFHTFFRCGGYRAMVFAPLRCPKLFRFPFACLRAAPSACFAHRLYTKNALPLGRAFGLLQPYCQGLFQHLTALFIMIAHLGRKSKKMINPHEFRLYSISFQAAKETLEPPDSQSYNANTSS